MATPSAQANEALRVNAIDVQRPFASLAGRVSTGRNRSYGICGGVAPQAERQAHP
jgi:hypothetical protein